MNRVSGQVLRISLITKFYTSVAATTEQTVITQRMKDRFDLSESIMICYIAKEIAGMEFNRHPKWTHMCRNRKKKNTCKEVDVWISNGQRFRKIAGSCHPAIPATGYMFWKLQKWHMPYYLVQGTTSLRYNWRKGTQLLETRTDGSF